MAKLNRNQDGMTSIVITLIIMAMLTLITIGFATLMRREQRQAVDRQLSSQAFYAAESGIDDALYAIRYAGYTGQKLTECGDDGIGAYMASGYSNFGNSQLNVAYTCLLIDQKPPEISLSPGVGNSSVSPLLLDAVADHLAIKWGGKTAKQNLARTSTPVWPTKAVWGATSTGVLRLDVTQIPGGAVTTDALAANTRTFFLVPSTNGATLGSWASPNGSVVVGNCPSATSDCTTEIGGLSSQYYYIRARAIYNDVDVTIGGQLADDTPILTHGSQVTLDVTGRANDVLRRIKVTKPYSFAYANEIPSFSMQSSNGICKRLEVIGGLVAQVDSIYSSAATYPECDPFN